MKKVLSTVLVSTILSGSLSMSAQARSWDLPAGCEYGRDTSYDVSSENIQTAINEGYDLGADQETTADELGEWVDFLDALVKLFNSYDYLRVESPKHVLQDVPFRAKGNMFDPYAYIKFYNSEKGYVGKDKSNLEANSYLNMSLDETYGVGLVWVQRGGLCSAESVWVQKAPQLSKVDIDGGRTIRTIADYNIDQYSKAAKDTNTKAKVQVFAELDGGGYTAVRTIYLNNNSGRLTADLTPNINGLYNVYAVINDGKYNKTVQFGSTIFNNGGGSTNPCPTCGPINRN